MTRTMNDKRWLYWVLAALLASGALTAWLVLAPHAETPPAAVSTGSARSDARADE